MKRTALIPAMLTALYLTGCASVGFGGDDGEGNENSSARTTASTAASETREGIGDAVLTPVSDLNLIDRDIPPVLARIENPYALDVASECVALSEEVIALNTVLGDDADADYVENDAEERGRDAAGATLGLVSATAGGLIPFRGLVRYVSGASEADQEIIAAYLRGHQRRGFLRGVAEARAC